MEQVRPIYRDELLDRPDEKFTLPDVEFLEVTFPRPRIYFAHNYRFIPFMREEWMGKFLEALYHTLVKRLKTDKRTLSTVGYVQVRQLDLRGEFLNEPPIGAMVRFGQMYINIIGVWSHDGALGYHIEKCVKCGETHRICVFQDAIPKKTVIPPEMEELVQKIVQIILN